VRQSLYKYFSKREWAEAFLGGQVRFQSLSYFRDYEEQGVRGDKNEGTAIFRPDGGLVITNHTQRKILNPANSAFEARANQNEIYVFCTSKVLNDEMRTSLQARVCVEILRIQTFFTRLRNGLRLRPGTVLRNGPVDYYDPAEGGSPRWAFPEMIALSKTQDFDWQHEYRFVFGTADALEFEKASYRVVIGEPKDIPKITEHEPYTVKCRTLRDICTLHEF
jgi:hypothetical protein